MTAKAAIPRREPVSIAILVIGGLIYALLCMPAIQQRGYPPIDPIWTAMTFLWIVPLLLSCWCDTSSFPARRHHLWIYALATAFINSGTGVTVVPKRVNPPEMLVMTVVLYGPVHLVVTFGLESIVQTVLGRWRTVSEEAGRSERRQRVSLLAWVYVFTIVCIAIGLPTGFRTFAIQSMYHRGREAAEREWNTSDAVVFGDGEQVWINDALVEYRVDRKTGLPVQPIFGKHQYATAYNQRMNELLSERRDHPTRHRNTVPTPDVVVGLLDSVILREITEVPHDVTPGIVVFRKGTVSRWGSTMTSGDDGLSISTEYGGWHGGGTKTEPIYVGVDQPLAGQVAIRGGTSWVGVFQADGRMIASASRWK
jgi:hypothetical protein